LQVLLDSDLNDRVLRIEDLQDKIELINYIFAAEITDTYLAANSIYWKTYGIVIPTITAPTTQSVGGATVPQPDYAVQSIGAAASHWQNIVDDITVSISFFSLTILIV